MPSLTVYNAANEEVSNIELSDEIFGVEVRESLFYAAVRYQLAKRRAGTHSTKSRSQVSGGGKKPFKQKGTGRARAGTTRAVQWRGGGVVHGPHYRSHAHNMNKKARRAALCAALSRRCEEGRLTVIDSIEFSEAKTKQFRSFVQKFDFEREDLLLVTAEKDENIHLSARNLPKVTVLPVAGINVYDILKHRNLAFTTAAVELVQERLGGK
jgi:large subunit ribosomal protein L4